MWVRATAFAVALGGCVSIQPATRLDLCEALTALGSSQTEVAVEVLALDNATTARCVRPESAIAFCDAVQQRAEWQFPPSFAWSLEKCLAPGPGVVRHESNAVGDLYVSSIDGALSGDVRISLRATPDGVHAIRLFQQGTR